MFCYVLLNSIVAKIVCIWIFNSLVLNMLQRKVVENCMLQFTAVNIKGHPSQLSIYLTQHKTILCCLTGMQFIESFYV